MLRPRFVFSLALLAGLIAGGQSVGKEPYQRVVPLLKDTKTILGDPLAYPYNGTPQIHSVIVTMLPDEETGPHTHPYPTYGYMLEGELTVTYPGGVEKVYRAGDAFMEAVNTVHNGRNSGTEPARVLVVFMGVEGEVNTLLSKKP